MVSNGRVGSLSIIYAYRPGPFLFADLRSEKGKDDLLAWLRREVLFV